jgi:hypothetical protein
MSDCDNCIVEKECYYPYKPCECVHQRKFWSKERKEEHDNLNSNMKVEKIKVNGKVVDIITEYDLMDLQTMLTQIRITYPKALILIVENELPIPSQN